MALQLASALCAYAGQSLSCRFAFAALIVTQNVNLKPAAELNVTKVKQFYCTLLRRFAKSKV